MLMRYFWFHATAALITGVAVADHIMTDLTVIYWKI